MNELGMKMLNREVIMLMLLPLPGNHPILHLVILFPQHPVIFVRDIEASILELLVRYMYSGQVCTTVYIAS